MLTNWGLPKLAKITAQIDINQKAFGIHLFSAQS